MMLEVEVWLIGENDLSGLQEKEKNKRWKCSLPKTYSYYLGQTEEKQQQQKQIKTRGK